jgi:DNA (cytosine-5)-methyltransferase 1
VNVGSLFSGIGGLDEGLRRAGHRHVFFCESDPYRRDVLRARFPGVPVYEDVREVDATSLGRGGGAVGGGGARADAERDGSPLSVEPVDVDLLCGGFPCQDLSVAGRRAGLDGARSGLFFEFARIIDALRPGWVLVENVPGLLSSNGGRDFGVVLGTLADLGYGVAWRVLDSRFFGVPQRRRRVFIVGAVAVGDPGAAAERAGEVLAVGSRCQRHPATRGEAGPDVASPLGGSVGKGRGHDGNPFDRGGHSSLSGLGSGGPDDNDAQAGRLVAMNLRGREGGAMPEMDDVASLRAADGGSSRSYIAGTLKSQRGKGGGGIGPEETLVAAPLTKGSATGEGVNQPGRRQEDDVNIVAFNASGGGEKDLMPRTNLANPVTGSNGDPGAIAGSVGVRRLTPTECERLQGLPDGWTQLGDTPDSRRYSALGDAVTANVSEWIGGRLAQAA